MSILPKLGFLPTCNPILCVISTFLNSGPQGSCSQPAAELSQGFPVPGLALGASVIAYPTSQDSQSLMDVDHGWAFVLSINRQIAIIFPFSLFSSDLQNRGFPVSQHFSPLLSDSPGQKVRDSH